MRVCVSVCVCVCIQIVGEPVVGGELLAAGDLQSLKPPGSDRFLCKFKWFRSLRADEAAALAASEALLLGGKATTAGAGNATAGVGATSFGRGPAAVTPIAMPSSTDAGGAASSGAVQDAQGIVSGGVGGSAVSTPASVAASSVSAGGSAAATPVEDPNARPSQPSSGIVPSSLLRLGGAGVAVAGSKQQQLLRFVAIPGAKKPRYTPTPDDVGTHLRVEVYPRKQVPGERRSIPLGNMLCAVSHEPVRVPEPVRDWVRTHSAPASVTSLTPVLCVIDDGGKAGRSADGIGDDDDLPAGGGGGAAPELPSTLRCANGAMSIHSRSPTTAGALPDLHCVHRLGSGSVVVVSEPAVPSTGSAADKEAWLCVSFSYRLRFGDAGMRDKAALLVRELAAQRGNSGNRRRRAKHTKSDDDEAVIAAVSQSVATTARLASTLKEATALKEELESLRGEHERHSAELEALRDETAALRSERADLAGDNDTLQSQHEEVCGKLLESSERLDEREATIAELNAELQRAEARCVDLQSRLGEREDGARTLAAREEDWARERETAAESHERALQAKEEGWDREREMLVASHESAIDALRRQHAEEFEEAERRAAQEMEAERNALRAELAAVRATSEKEVTRLNDERRAVEDALRRENSESLAVVRAEREGDGKKFMAERDELSRRLNVAEEGLAGARAENGRLMKIARDVVHEDLDRSAEDTQAETTTATTTRAQAGGDPFSKDMLLEETVQGARKHMKENSELRIRIRALEAEVTALRRRVTSTATERKRLVDASVTIAAMKGRQQVLMSEATMLREVVAAQISSAMDVTKDIMTSYTRSAKHRIASEGELSELRAKCRAAESALDWERKRAESLLKRERDRADRERRHREELERDSKRREVQATEYIRMAYGELGSGRATVPRSAPSQKQKQHQQATPHYEPPHEQAHESVAPSSPGPSQDSEYHTPVFGTPVAVSPTSASTMARSRMSLTYEPRRLHDTVSGDFSSFNEWYKYKKERFTSGSSSTTTSPPHASSTTEGAAPR